MRRLTLLLVALVTVAVASAAAPVSASAAPGPKVVIVVGPSGDATDHYRADARRAEVAALRYTPNVVRIVSPDATWPVVRQALQNASLVVYLGHGNGWPSRYRSELYPPTQNGFGLNVVQGGDDDTHQYFGEKYIRRDVHLAPNAVVVLNHLCYASGNTEPGLPEGTVDDARQRVDNYAAGFIAAGARAVIADGHFGPAWYVDAILGGRRSIESTWLAAPSSNGGPILTFASERSPGFTIRMDPDRPTGGYYRSLVVEGQLASADVLGAAVEVGVEPAVPAALSLARSGVAFGQPAVGAPPTWTPPAPLPSAEPGARTTHVAIPYSAVRGSTLPDGIEIGARWVPLAPAAGAHVGKKQGVEPTAATVDANAIEANLAVPANPGRYRLILTLHDADGLAYDAETQAMLAPVEVDVTATTVTTVAAASVAGSAPTSPAGEAASDAADGASGAGGRSLTDGRPVTRPDLHGVVD